MNPRPTFLQRQRLTERRAASAAAHERKQQEMADEERARAAEREALGAKLYDVQFEIVPALREFNAARIGDAIRDIATALETLTEAVQKLRETP